MSLHYGSAATEPELYLEYYAKLLRRVWWAVNASPEDIEDACAFAWVQFLRRQPDRDRPWRSWLFETAKRQAWRLAAQRGDTLAIVDVDDQAVVFIRSQSSTQAQVAEMLGVSTHRIDQLLRAAGLKLRDISARPGSWSILAPSAARRRRHGGLAHHPIGDRRRSRARMRPHRVRRTRHAHARAKQ